MLKRAREVILKLRMGDLQAEAAVGRRPICLLFNDADDCDGRLTLFKDTEVMGELNSRQVVSKNS